MESQEMLEEADLWEESLQTHQYEVIEDLEHKVTKLMSKYIQPPRNCLSD